MNNPMKNLYGICSTDMNTIWHLTWLCQAGHIGLYSVELEFEVIQTSVMEDIGECISLAEEYDKNIRNNLERFEYYYKKAVDAKKDFDFSRMKNECDILQFIAEDGSNYIRRI